MTFPTFIFYFLSTVLVISALGVITARNPVHAALLLVLALPLSRWPMALLHISSICPVLFR